MRNMILGLFILFSGGSSSQSWSLSDELKAIENESSENYLFKFTQSNVSNSKKSPHYSELLDYLNSNRLSDFILYYELGYKGVDDTFENNFLLCTNDENYKITLFPAKDDSDLSKIKLKEVCSKLMNSSKKNGIYTLYSDESLSVVYGELPVYGLLKIENGKISYRQLKILRLSPNMPIADRVLASFTGPEVKNIEQQFFNIK